MAGISSINSLSSNNTFRKKDEFSLQPKQNKIRKVAVGASSFMLPGLGQIINNENPKGFTLLAVDMIAIGTYLAARKRSKVAAFFPWLVNLGIKCWAAVDAYKKSE